jgi:long-subunit acyl-CoA synthetase (AMP-forming)
LLTPTLKLKRPLVLARFKEAVDKVYANEGAAASDAGRARG